MRVKLSLTPEGPLDLKIPLNYNTWLVSAIYRWLALSSPDYADFLHNDGYRLDRKPYKLFCFSQLLLQNRKVAGDFISAGHERFTWLLCSAKQEFITHLVAGIEKDPSITIAGMRAAALRVERVPGPDLTPPLRFTCLSPITASVWDGSSEKNPTRYLTPGKQFTDAIASNLKRKFRLIYGRPPSDDRFTMSFDQDYISRRRTVTKLLEFKGIKVRGVLCPFVADGSAELIRVGYECGFGEKNSTGFGMVEERS